ncbi:MAG: DUF1294 domain-containing protein [Oscillospiraceae bacterium]|nr:DUF1294 domain-containing protein [Oscillospiraceae bacterium]
MKYLLYYLILINTVSFASMGIDKLKAAKGRWRISEKALFLLATAGGSIGSIAGMFTFRHKTKHLSFLAGLPAILVLQCAAAYFIWRFLADR